jgi:hypothetical protein
MVGITGFIRGCFELDERDLVQIIYSYFKQISPVWHETGVNGVLQAAGQLARTGLGGG